MNHLRFLLAAVCAAAAAFGQANPTPFVTNESFIAGARNNYSGNVGMKFTVGNTAVTVASLGRFVVPGNSQSHTLSLLTAGSGSVVASAQVSTAGLAGGQFAYALLANPAVLAANTSYYLVSNETAGGDFWYDYIPVTSTGAGTVNSPVYQQPNGVYVPVPASGYCYVPLSFLYSPGIVTTVTVTGPANGAGLSGGTTLTASASPAPGLSIVSVQFKIGPSTLPALSAPPYAQTFDTTTLPDGIYNVTATAMDSGGNAATSAPVSVTITNSAGAPQFYNLTTLAAGFSNPEGLAVDPFGNVYIADQFHNVIDKWSLINGQVSTVPLSGLSSPRGIALDASGNLYISDAGNGAIKEWMPSTGQSKTLVSNGVSFPEGIALDTAGNVYFANANNFTIQKYDAATTQVSTLIAGLNFPDGVAVDSAGNVFFSESNAHAVKEWVAATQQVITLVSAGLYSPGGVALDSGGNVYIADTTNGAIKEWNAVTKQVTTLASGFSYPGFVTVDTAGNVYFSDSSNNAVRKLSVGVLAPLSFNEPATAGNGQLQQIFPVTTALNATSDQSWLTITGQANGLLSFAFATNATGAVRTGHIALLGQTVTVTQAAVAVPAAADVSPSSLSFAASVGAVSVSQTVTLTNSGTGPLTINAISTNSALFSITANNCGGSLAAGGQCSVNLVFAPTAGGTQTATLTFTDNSSYGSTQTVSLTGVGTFPTVKFVTGVNLITGLRNNFSGNVGMKFTVGNAPITVQSLGRFGVRGDTQIHQLSLVSAATGQVLGTAQVDATGGSSNDFLYGPLGSPLQLAANTSYYLVSKETAGGDSWYDFLPVTTTSAGVANAPVYQQPDGVYVTVPAAGYCYVPLTFLYTAGAAPPTVTITTPVNGATVSGTIPLIATASAAAGASITSVQFQVGATVLPPSTSAPYGISFDTTKLADGPISVVATAVDSLGGTAVSAPVSVTVSNGGGAIPFLRTGNPGTALRNNYGGFVGMRFTVLGVPLRVSQLGRWVVPGSSFAHTLKLVNAADGTAVPGGSATLAANGALAEGYQYASLAAPVTLPANAAYYLVSSETINGDLWYDFGAVTDYGRGAAVVNWPVYTDAANQYIALTQFAGAAYVPVNFIYK